MKRNHRRGRMPPPIVALEDAGLLMYCDNGLMRIDEQPGQGRWLSCP